MVDGAVILEAKLHGRDLSVAWIDYRKAYDMDQHYALIDRSPEVHSLDDNETHTQVEDRYCSVHDTSLDIVYERPLSVKCPIARALLHKCGGERV